jgi:tryptophanyl-tRNA synthetase
VDAPKDPEKCNLFSLYKLFAPPERLTEVRGLYVNGGAMYGKIKLELVDLLWEYFREAREKRERLLADPGQVRDILRRGAIRAREKAVVTLDLVRDRVGLRY